MFCGVMYIVVSRKFTVLVEYVTSNLMVGWNEFRCSVNDWNVSSPFVQTRNISSMNLFQRSGVRWFGADESRDCSSAPINIFAKEGAILVPIAVPCFWRYSLSLNVK